MSNVTSSSSNPASPGKGITGGYQGDSLALKVCIAFFLSAAMYNVIELVVLIFATFQRFRGLYFWSLVASGLGIIPYSIGFLTKYFNILTGPARWASVFLLTIGWWPMITGQAIVLWSRLHLVVYGERGDRILRRTKWMIIVNAICLHIPTTILTWGSNANIPTFIDGYNIMEKLQMCGFFIQEVILSSIYIVETIKILRTSIQQKTKRIMYQLVAINVLIIIMDLGLLGLVAASLYILETIFKALLYSIKLKLEFAVLSKLVRFVAQGDADFGAEPSTRSIAYLDEDELGPPTAEKETGATAGRQNSLQVADFVDMTRARTNHTHASADAPARSSITRTGVTALDLDLARLEHAETLSSTHNEKNERDIEARG